MPIKSQADQRRAIVLTDQHGRKYSASIEKASGYPTGVVVPVDWSPPHPALFPPQKYMVFDADNPTHVQIDYPNWIGELETATKDWEEQRIRLGRMIHGGSFNARGPTPPELIVILGPRPLSPVPVRAMQQGNRWALGFTTIKPPEAASFFPDPETEPAPLAFSETAPVFTEPEAPTTSESVAAMIARLDRDCPKDLVGMARTNWVMKQMKAAAAQPQEA